MFSNYLLVSIRNLLKYKTYSLINILGLAVGLMCTLLILLWVKDELSVDRYHKNGNRIAQAYLKGIKDENTSYQPTVSPVIAKLLKEKFPEVINTVRIGYLDDVVLKYEDKIIVESLGCASDPSIFSIFSYQLVKGNPNTSLANPYSIILTETTAGKYFGNTEPVGKVIRINNKFDLLVTGVLKDLPTNAYRKFDFIVPFNFLKDLGRDIEGTPFYPCAYITYALLEAHTDTKILSEKVRKTIFSKGQEITFEIYMVPFNDIYSFETDGGSRSTILIFIALFILTIASINFINLSTARSMIRAKEIGIRKMIGASRFEIACQFLSESMVVTVIAAVLALVMTELSLSYFNRLTGKILTISLNDPIFLMGFSGLVLFTGLLAGIYPALYLSGFHPARILKNKIPNKTRGSYRRGLIVFQFVLSVFFIICTIVISRQINYIHNFNWGINRNNIIYVAMDGEIIKRYDAVKNELLKNPNIISVTSASRLPVAVTSGSFFKWGVNDNIARRICPIVVGYDFTETFGIKMTQGRFYSREFSGDSSDAVIVNETAIRKIGFQTPVGGPFYLDGRYYTLIGVVKDYQHNSPLNQQTEPMIFLLNPGGNQFLFARIDPSLENAEAIASTVNYIHNTCNSFSPERPLSCQFLSEVSFSAEQNLENINRLILLSAVLMIVVSCLGLFGLSAFINERRTKEIGVRKVLGASAPGIIIMLSKEFFKWVIMANLIAWPLAYYAMQNVLQNYAFRVPIGIWIFAGAGLCSLLIALLTVAWQAIRAALANPADSMRYE